MEKSILYTMPITYIILLFIVALHIGSVFFSADSTKKLPLIILYTFTGINLLLHVALFILAIVKNAPASEMLLALMISAAVGSISIGIKKKN